MSNFDSMLFSAHTGLKALRRMPDHHNGPLFGWESLWWAWVWIFTINNYWFKQDKARAHRDHNVDAWLETHFGNRLNTRTNVEGSSKFSELKPLNFHFWGYLKYRVHAFTQKKTFNTWKRTSPDKQASCLHMFLATSRGVWWPALSRMTTILSICLLCKRILKIK